jgi:hypothetical protein
MKAGTKLRGCRGFHLHSSPPPSGQGSVEGLIIDEVLMVRRTMEMGGI